MLKARLGVGLDGVHGALRLANAAVDALVRIDNEHGLTFVETVYRADLNTISEFALDASIQYDIGQGGISDTR